MARWREAYLEAKKEAAENENLARKWEFAFKELLRCVVENYKMDGLPEAD